MFRDSLIKKPRDLESYVQYVYSNLLNLKDEGVVVSKNAILIGRSGTKHEIDVFYQFEKTKTIHKVAFECKFASRKVQKSAVIDFYGKLQDIGNIQGIFVSKSGYQQGAQNYANHYGIQLLTIDDLPTLNILLAKRIESIALPDETYIGEPFWTIMITKNGSLTGDYFTQKRLILLFISKKDACDYINSVPKNKDLVVRGLPQYSLKFLLATATQTVQFALMYGVKENNHWLAVPCYKDELTSRFLLERFKD